MTESIIRTVDHRGIATLTINREQCHNAIDRESASLLTANLETLGEDPGIRAIILTGAGISFSAGRDLSAMRDQAGASLPELHKDARNLTRLLDTLDQLNKPTIARVQGSAFGLGVGIIACCDFALGASDALFGISEARMGTVACIIAPFVMRAIGARAARRYLISTERFNAAKAKRLGLLHQDLPASELDSAIEQLVQQLLLNSPQAMSETKRLIRQLEHGMIDQELLDQLAMQSASFHASEEGREGVAAYIEHRQPQWRPN
jgi:methylglutaconyl-CoA hydratase